MIFIYSEFNVSFGMLELFCSFGIVCVCVCVYVYVLLVIRYNLVLISGGLPLTKLLHKLRLFLQIFQDHKYHHLQMPTLWLLSCGAYATFQATLWDRTPDEFTLVLFAPTSHSQEW